MTGENALAGANEIQHIVIQSLALQGLGYLYLRQGNWSSALECMKECERILEPSDNQWMRLMMGPILAEAFWGVGELENGLRAANENIAARPIRRFTALGSLVLAHQRANLDTAGNDRGCTNAPLITLLLS